MGKTLIAHETIQVERLGGERRWDFQFRGYVLGETEVLKNIRKKLVLEEGRG